MTAEAVAAAAKQPPDLQVPDVLETLAQLPNDDVYTPPKVVAAMLDILPEHVWSEPHYTWLDPAAKSGIFLREAFRRLMVGLAAWEPDGQKRREHIVKNMIFGAATTQINGEITRRSLYQTKNATGKEVKDLGLAGLVVQFDSPDGNVPFVETEHTLTRKGDKCSLCKAPSKLIRDQRESYAYSFIHKTYPTKEMGTMKFDVIIGNPPYQMGTEGHGKTASSIYHLFVERAIAMNPRYVVMITPSRWFAGGKGMDNFRDRMIADRRLRILVNNPKIYDVFPQVKIRGGVSYFLWDRDYDGDVEFQTRVRGELKSSVTRDLREGDGVVVRDNRALSIIRKVISAAEPQTVEDISSVTKPFGLTMRSNYKGSVAEPFEGAVPLIYATKIGYSRPDQIERNHEWIDRWKVILPMVSSGDTPEDDEGNIIDVVLGEPIALAPGSACTQTYFIPGMFSTREETENFAYYLATKFVRFLVLQRKISQHVTPDRFRFVPMLDMTRRWTDSDLFARYGLSPEEIEYIETSIKPRSIILSLDSPIPETHLPGGRKYRAGDAAVEPDDEGNDE
ncbi:Eco57I restriction-modification methylase domain-containing protein [Microbacterium oryzae]|uniref:Eco57I restriction-modification methylase domain-containing protein n=1 Tax=Microbacterium oryzae TaxID=743009 RepID=UPI0025B22581|nr:Eco57I restriction-modification methylase domain-containing protein [Microbacterium oryzae]MDN3312040.1 Eco57I restriction-modification methylase domain-containing protein [Microbacterium oryzae]